MTNQGQTSSGSGSTKEAVTDSAKQVASTSAHEAGEMAKDAWSQVRGLVDRANGEARGQADQQARRAAGGMRQWSEQLRALTEGRPQEAGHIGELARDAAERFESWARRIDQQGLDGVMQDVSRFARRRPGLFLAACAGAGFAAGRLAKAARASQQSQSQGQGQGMYGQYGQGYAQGGYGQYGYGSGYPEGGYTPATYGQGTYSGQSGTGASGYGEGISGEGARTLSDAERFRQTGTSLGTATTGGAGGEPGARGTSETSASTAGAADLTSGPVVDPLGTVTDEPFGQGGGIDQAGWNR